MKENISRLVFSSVLARTKENRGSNHPNCCCCCCCCVCVESTMHSWFNYLPPPSPPTFLYHSASGDLWAQYLHPLILITTSILHLNSKCRRRKSEVAVVQWNRLRSGGLGIPERIGSNTDYDLSGNWASTRGTGSLVGGLSHRRPPLGGFL